VKRADQKLLNREAWYRPAIRNFEHAVKRFSFGAIGAWIRPHQVTPPLSLDTINSILILRYDALGDLVLTTPIIRVLKARKPSLVIGVAGSKKNLDLIHADPDVDHRYTFIQKSNEGVWRAIKQAREIKWDVIINLVYNDKTRGAIIARLINPDAIRITAIRKSSADYSKLYSIVGSRPPLRPPTPMLEQFLATLTQAVDLEIKAEEKQPSLKLEAAIIEEVRSAVASRHSTADTSRLLVLNTSSSELFREWGFENAWELSLQLSRAYPELLILWTGAPDKREELLQFFETHQEAKIGYFETKTPSHLAVLIGESVLVVSPDTSIVHIASAMRKSVVGLFMETNEFLPYGVACRVLTPKQDQALRTILVEDVMTAASELLTVTI
jgi:ADP-heptose:LPS heptosyltransferase